MFKIAPNPTRKPRGKIQKAILAYIARADGAVEITDMCRSAEFRRIHFGAILNAAEKLTEKGLLLQG